MATSTHAVTHYAPKAIRRPGIFKRIVYWIMDWDDEAFMEEGLRRMRSAPGFFASLTPEQLEFMRTYDGPEVHGPPLTQRERRDLERRTAARKQN
jgi:hypothetical protein